jgi:hypothetical protein
MPAAQETGGCRRKGVISDPGSFGRRAQTAEPMSQGVRPRLGIGVQDGKCDIGEDFRPYFFSFFFTCDLDACCSSRIISFHEESHFSSRRSFGQVAKKYNTPYHMPDRSCRIATAGTRRVGFPLKATPEAKFTQPVMPAVLSRWTERSLKDDVLLSIRRIDCCGDPLY